MSAFHWSRTQRLSLVARYTLLSVAVVAVALVALSFLYQRFSNELVDRLTGERLNAQVAATSNKLSAFLDARIYQLVTLSNHPALTAFVNAPNSAPAEEALTLLRVEADSPDLYGILFFDGHDQLDRLVAGQAASGPPYWSKTGWDITNLPRVMHEGVEFIGPKLPENGNSGWLLMRQQIRDSGSGQNISVALHVRLASLTELLASAGVSGVIEPLLRTPGGVVLDPTGRPTTVTGELIEGPSVLPGWNIVMSVHPGTILQPIDQTRFVLYVAAAVIILVILAIFFALSRSLRRRVDTLVQGANSIASGDLYYRLPEGYRRDEISTVAKAFNIMARQLKDLIDRTVRAEKLAVLGQFATGVAHEVRNPLATMKTTVQALTKREQDEERKVLLHDMGSQIDRLSRVVNDLLSYGRPGEAAPRPTMIRDLFRQTSNTLEPIAEEAGVRLFTSGDSRLSIFVDPDQILQVLLNLGINAVQACDANGTVGLRAVDCGGAVEIRVTDDGCGIPREHLLDVIQPFFTMKSKGTGLGLTISQQLVEANNGTINIESAPQEGTTIIVILPAARPEIVQEEKSENVQEDQNTDRRR
ncbi:sensor histidine kinase [Aestuariispira ectoiniformans]|uniref:sensor histidine kinase n=1 Tax=Aestuariispira ectoiniformans TaxID=2775080 RepID=UPI00223B903C|nr:sensor histidine kinase [Aestuariispira ectoiniformans]